MSSQPCPKLLDLAPEMVGNVIKQVRNKRDLSNARLACKTLEKHAANELFRAVFVSPLEDHVSSWNSISRDDVIRQIPRHAIIHTQSDIEDHGYGAFREREEIGEDFKEAVAALSRFPNLDSVEIGFTPECVGQKDESWRDVPEDISQRKEMLTLIFRAIKNRAADEKNRTIRKLTIINLQNCPIPDFTSSNLFRDVVGQLEELHISMTQEVNEAGPDHDYTRIELQTFPAYLCLAWLEPISTNLKKLSIYHGFDNWGPFPGYFDPSGISFPKLETLALGYYTLVHDSDFDWVLAIKSLRKLILQNCMIASSIRIGARNSRGGGTDNLRVWKVQTHDWTKIPQDRIRWTEEFAYGGKWSQFLDGIAGALPNLVDFRFGYGSSWRGETRYSVTDRDSCGVDMFPQRYVSFDNGTLPTHWREATDEGEMRSRQETPLNLHKDNFEADQKSLNVLLHTLRRSTN